VELNGKTVRVILAIIALASAYPSSRTGSAADRHLDAWSRNRRTARRHYAEAACLLGAQLLLAFFVWRFSERKAGAKVWNIPGRHVDGRRAFILVARKFCPRVLGQKAWANVYFTPPSPMPCRFRRKRAIRFLFPTPVLTENLARCIGQD